MKTLIYFLIAILITLSTSTVSAMEGPNAALNKAEQREKLRESVKDKMRSPRASISPQAEGLKQRCENRSTNIKKRSGNLVRHATKMVSTFDRISTRAKNFYQNKLVSKGVTVANYDTLSAAVDTAKANVQKAIAESEQTITSFDCDKGTTKETLTAFRQAMQKTNEQLKAYREAVRKLVQAIHKAAIDAKPSPTASVSPTVSSTPSPTS